MIPLQETAEAVSKSRLGGTLNDKPGVGSNNPVR